MSIETLTVDLPDRNYDIAIGPGLLAEAGVRILPFLTRPKVAIITDETVANIHMDTLQSGLRNAGISSSFIAMPAGEKTKSWKGLEAAVEWLIEQRVERDDLVVAFGGGVIGDLAGFAAAILRRGVEFVQIPTSLLAQVDSSVGGENRNKFTAWQESDRCVSPAQTGAGGYRCVGHAQPSGVHFGVWRGG